MNDIIMFLQCADSVSGILHCQAQLLINTNSSWTLQLEFHLSLVSWWGLCQQSMAGQYERIDVLKCSPFICLFLQLQPNPWKPLLLCTLFFDKGRDKREVLFVDSDYNFFSSWCMQYYKYVREIPFALTGSLSLAKATAEGKI